MVHEEKLADGRVRTTRNIECNCVGNQPFMEWLTGIHMDGLGSGLYGGWCMDGGFVGLPYGGRFVIPAACPSSEHDHLPGDSNYASERALDRLVAAVRQRHPKIFIFHARPVMDLGVWSCRNADGVFTLHESGQPEALKGLKDQPVNVIFGDKIRRWSRVRVHHHFLPHYLDSSLLFPQVESMGHRYSMPWPSEKIDYIMLSALSCSPNQLFYLPTKAGIPAQDKAELRKWLAWGRKHVRLLQVRHDLPEWPAAEVVDGSAHIIKGRGFIFLFNPNPDSLDAEFSLNSECIGLHQRGTFRLAQHYPASNRATDGAYGQTVRWPVTGESAVVLEIRPYQQEVCK
jgi:hypothetical protein